MKPKKDFGNLKKNEEFIELGPNESNVRDRGLIVQGSLAYTSTPHYLGSIEFFVNLEEKSSHD